MVILLGLRFDLIVVDHVLVLVVIFAVVVVVVGVVEAVLDNHYTVVSPPLLVDFVNMVECTDRLLHCRLEVSRLEVEACRLLVAVLFANC